MALGRISGPLLKADLQREGVDLAVETNLIYFEVNTHAADVAADPGNTNPWSGRVGIKTDTPAYDLEVNGTLKATVYRMDELNIGNGVLTGNVVVTDGYWKTLVGDLHLQAEPITGKVILDSNTKINGNLEVTGDITLGGTINIGNLNDDLVIFNGEIGSDFIPDITDTYDIGTALKRWDNGYYKVGYLGNLSIGTNTIQANNTDGSITLTPNGAGTVVIAGATALQIPSGNEASKSNFTAATGQIRLNTTTNQFEGYANSNWTSLGGVRSVDNLTYITAELTPGASDDTIRFYTNGTLRGSVDASGLALNDAETIKFFDQDNSAYVSVRAPDAVDQSYIIKLPTAQPFEYTVLGNDGIGNTEWTSPDTFGGNRVYVSKTKGNDANDGINQPVLTIKRGLQIAALLTYVPVVDPGVGYYNAKRLLEENRLYIQSEVIGFIETTYNTPPGSFVYDSIKCKRDVGLIVDAVIYDIIYGGNRRSVEAGQSYLAVPAVVGAQKTQTLAAINKARDISLSVIQNLTPGTTYQNIVLQTKHETVPGTAAVADVTAKFNVIYGILNTGSSPTIVEPSFTKTPVTVYVSSGDYYIDNPVIVGDNVSVIGDSLRSVVIRPLNANKDMFRMRNGAYINNLTFRDGLNVSLVPSYTFSWAVAFDDPLDTSVDRTGYIALANTKPIITLSPYIQNCSIISFLGGNGVWVDGSKVVTPNVPANNIEAENPVNLTNGIPEQGKSMVGNAFTMLSFGGTGWLITNDAYAQLVSCFQIFMLNGTYTQSGGYISITNSATNFGLYALRSSGYSPNSFTFDRGYIVASGSSGGAVTLTSIGTRREPVNQYVLRIKDALTDNDVTSSFKEATVTKSFNAATDINISTNIFTITSHGMLTGTAVYYSNNGNADVLGLLNTQLYYVSTLSSSTFKLFYDSSLSFPVDILAAGTGTHQFLLNVEDFYLGKTIETHSTYQELTLTPGVYSFVAGTQILGDTASVQNTAYAYSYNPATYKLIVSNEYSVVSGNLQRILFTNASTITSIGGSGVSIAVTAATSILNTYYTSTFTVVSTISGNQLLTPSNSILQKINFHRPSIVNSSAHTWEFAGAGTDYNALPQNGGVSKGTVYEQYSELPGRVYSSGTNELGDFKVGDFIVAENKTGDITFKTQVTIGELSVLKLSLSSVEVSEFSTDTGLGDNEPGGPSNSRISVQRAVRSFIANRLGKVLDKDVSTNSVPGSLVQLNASGQINQDLIPPSRGVTTYSVTGYGSRVTLSELIPSVSVIAGDNASETYAQRTLDLNSALTVVAGDVITQVGNTGYGLIKESGTLTTIVLVNTTGTFDLVNDLKVNGVTQTGIVPTVSYAVVNIVDNYYLKTDTTSQFLILYPGVVYDFTGITIVTGANSSAQGEITSGPIYGIAYSANTNTLVQGSGYTPAVGTVIYYAVPLTNITGTGSGAKADITVTNGSVVAVAISVGGTGYAVGNTVSANAANIGGTVTSPFSIDILRADTRLYVNLLGTFVKFIATNSTPEYIEDANAAVTTIPDLTAFLQKNFDARDVTSGGNVDYSLNVINITSHTFEDGDAVIYSTAGNPVIGNMINTKTYWVKVVNTDTIELYTNYAFTSGSKVIFGSSSTGVHNFKRYAVNTNSNTFYAYNHGITQAATVRFSATTPPGGLTDNNYYYVGSVTANTFTLHTIKSDAVASATGITVNAVTITSTGSGSATLTQQTVQIIGTTNTSSATAANWGAIAQATIDAVNIVSGTVSPSRLGSTGSATNKTFLRGDSSWQYAVQNIKPNTDSPITIVGDYYTTGLTNYYYNALTFDINRASDALGDVTYTNLGVAGFNKSQFTVTTGNVTVKTGVIDAGFLGGNAPSYYTNPLNIVGNVPISKGGTNLSTYTKGDMLYSGSANSLTQLPIGVANSILTSDGLIPSWSSTLSLNAAVISANTSTPAFRITQTGTGDAFVVEDSANPDSTPFVINNVGKVSIGGVAVTDAVLRISQNITGNTLSFGTITTSNILSDVTARADVYFSAPTTQATQFTVPVVNHFSATGVAVGEGSTITTQAGVVAGASINKAANNFGIQSQLAANAPAVTGVAFTTAAVNANVVTITTAINHGLSTGQIVAINTLPVADGSFVVGTPYTIIYVGTTDFTLIGAASNTIGVTFTATGAGSTTGTGFARPAINDTAVVVTVTGNTTFTYAKTVATFTSRSVAGTLIPAALTTATISNISILSNLVTVTTLANHGYSTGQRVTITTTPIAAGSFISNVVYTIAEVGNTDFTLIGAASNTVGVTFTATGPGAIGSTGTARLQADGSGYAITVLSNTTFTYARTTANVSSQAAGGLVTPNSSWNIFADGTAPSYFAGKIGIGLGEPTADLHIRSADGDIKIGNIKTGVNSTDSGFVFNNTNNLVSALFTELNGEILSYGINTYQLDYNYDSTRSGGIFRLDTRTAGTVGDAHSFVVKRRAANSMKEVTAFVVDLDTGTTYLAPASATYTNGNVSIGGQITATPTYKLEVTGTGYFSSNVTIDGDLLVNGNTVTVNSTTLSIDDKNIDLGAVIAIASVSGTITGTTTTTTITGITTTSGMIPGQVLTRISGPGFFGGVTTITSVDSLTQITVTSATANTAGAIVFSVGAATDLTADGGGITLKGTTDKTITYSNANTRWQTNISLGVNGSLTVGTGSAAGTITSQGSQNLVLNTNAGTTSGNITIVQGTNGNVEIAPQGTGLTRIVNAGDAIARVERTGATATYVDVIARSGSGEILTSVGALRLNPANKTVFSGFTDGGTWNLYSSSSTAQAFPQLAIDNYSANGGFPVVELRMSKGTLASPLDVGTSTNLGGFNTWGYGGTSKGFKSATRIQGISRDTFLADTNVSAALDFFVTNASTQFQTLRLDFDGTMIVGRSATATTITTNGASNLTLNTNGGTNSGSILINNGANGNIVITANGTGNVNVTSNTIALGTSSATLNTVTIGGAITGNTLKIAGTAGGTINLTTDVTTGAVSVFPSLTTATMTIGSANAGTVAIAFNKASTSTTTGALTVAGGVGINGALNALTKSFVIPHPTKKGKLLRHGSLEGPEFGVYVRGRCSGNVIELPEYWTGLVDEDTITVDLTPIGKHQKLYVEKIEGNKVYIANDAMFTNAVNCFYTVWSERKDVDSLDVEVDE